MIKIGNFFFKYRNLIFILLYLALFIPFFLFVYQAIVLAEENFLRNKFGQLYTDYCQRIQRWIPSLRRIGDSFRKMHFKWKRWVLKEYNTQYI